MKKPLVLKAYNRIKDLLIERKIKPGDIVSEKALVSLVNTGRTPIREALRILHADGLITLIPRKGVIVNKLSLKDIQDIYYIRIGLECIAAELATKSIPKEDLAKIKSESSDLYNKKDIAYEEVFPLSKEFHQMIIDTADNKLLAEIIQRIRFQIEMIMPLTARISSRNREILGEHLNIIEAFEKGDALEAARRMREHLQKGLTRTIEVYKL